MNRNRWPLLILFAVTASVIAVVLSSPGAIAQTGATQTQNAVNTQTQAAINTMNAAVEQTTNAEQTDIASTQTASANETATASSPTPSDTPTSTNTSTSTDTLTPSPTATHTPTPVPTATPVGTFTPFPTPTPLGTAAPGAHWEWPVCGGTTSRNIGTFFDHYYSTWESFGLDSLLTQAGDGVGLIAPYNADVCHSYDIGWGSWCKEASAGRSDQSGLTEFQAISSQPSLMPDGLVVAPHTARVMWQGLVTQDGYEQSVDTKICKVGGWQYGLGLGFHLDEYVVMTGLSSTSIRQNDVVEQGSVLGAGTLPTSYGNAVTIRSSMLRAMHSAYGAWFDPLGWGEDRYDDYVAYDRGLDPNYQRGGVPSQRRIDPLDATGPECLSACNSTRYVVDDSGADFSCPLCSGPISSSEAYSDSYRVLVPTGNDTETGAATWTAVGASPGVYSVYAWLGWMVDTNADSVPDTETSPAARYRAGSTTFVASQKADGPATAGWYYVGTFDYATSPYVALSDAAYSDQNHPAQGYIDSSTCGRIYVDAVVFTQTCSTVGATAVPGTVVPAVTATPNCLTAKCGAP